MAHEPPELATGGPALLVGAELVSETLGSDSPALEEEEGVGLEPDSVAASEAVEGVVSTVADGLVVVVAVVEARLVVALLWCAAFFAAGWALCGCFGVAALAAGVLVVEWLAVAVAEVLRLTPIAAAPTAVAAVALSASTRLA